MAGLALSDERLRQHGQIPIRKRYPGYTSCSAVVGSWVVRTKVVKSVPIVVRQ